MPALTANVIFVCAQQSVTVRVHGMRGWIGGLQHQPDHYRRIGGRGTGTQSTGQQARPEAHPIWAACAKKADAVLMCTNLEAMQGFVAQVTDQFGRVLPRVKVRSVVITAMQRTKGPLVSASVSATYRVEASLELELLPDD